MKGFTGKGRMGWMSGGKIRDLGGVKAPAYGSQPKVMAEAKGKTTGMVGMKGIGAEGKPARPSLARPGRKTFRHGGRVGKADGGDVKSMHRQDLEQVSADEPASVGNKNALLSGAGVATALHFLGRSRLATPIRGLMGAAGIGATYKGGKGLAEDYGKMSKAIDARSELKKRDAADQEAGGYASGGKTKWIAGAISRPGALHRKLYVPEGEKIPVKKLTKAEHSSDPTTRRQANLAKTLKGFHR